MKNKITVVVVAILLLVIGLIAVLVNYGNQYTEHEYTLYEIQDGVYGVYNTVVSNVPADNYDVITLCCNGQIRTFKGNIHIVYTEAEAYAKYKNSNMVNADELWVYVPFGTIEYQGTTGMSR